MLIFEGGTSYLVPQTTHFLDGWTFGDFHYPFLIHDFFQSTPVQLSSVQNPGWLDYIEDSTTQLYRDYFISHSKDPVTNQPRIQWNVTIVVAFVLALLPPEFLHPFFFWKFQWMFSGFCGLVNTPEVFFSEFVPEKWLTTGSGFPLGGFFVTFGR